MATLYRWAAMVGAFLLAVCGALIYGFSRGDKSGQAGVKAADAKETQSAVAAAQVAKQNVSAGPTGSAASELGKDWQS